MVSEMEVIWSERARITYFQVLNYLENNWSSHEIVRFINRTEAVIKAIKKNPGIYVPAVKQRNIRRAVIDKNNSFFYQVDEKKKIIFLLTFFDNRQNPQKWKVD